MGFSLRLWPLFLVSYANFVSCYFTKGYCLHYFCHWFFGIHYGVNSFPQRKGVLRLLVPSCSSVDFLRDISGWGIYEALNYLPSLVRGHICPVHQCVLLTQHRAWQRTDTWEVLSKDRERTEACLQMAWGLWAEKMAGKDGELLTPP